MPKKKVLPSSKKAAYPKTKRIKNNLMLNRIIGLFFVIVALGFLLIPSLIPTQKQTDKNPISINSSLYLSKFVANNPVRILIPSVQIDLAIVDAKVVNGFWELSENTASYGLGSGEPGQKNNTVIFAHARQGLFYNLKDVKLSDTIYIFTKNKWYRYNVTKITSVYPNQIEVIKPTKTETLTLYTCTGFADQKRLIVQAVPHN